MELVSQMDEQALKSKIKLVLMDELGVAEDKVTPDAKLIEDLGVVDRALGFVELSIRLEQEFGSALPDDEMDQVHTVAELYQCVIRNTPEDVSLP